MTHRIYQGIRKIILAAVTGSIKKIPHWKTAPYVDVYPPLLSLPVSLPVNHHRLPVPFANQFIRQKSIPARRIFILKEVNVSGQGVVFRNLRVFVPSLTWLRDIDLFRKADLLVKQWKKDLPALPATTPAALIYDDWSAANYYHWMIEALPKLLLLEAKFPGVVIFSPEPAPEFISSTLSLFGVKNIYPLNRHRASVVKVSTLLLPELVYYEEKEEDVLREQQGRKESVGALRNHAPSVTGPFLANEELIVLVRKRLLQHLPAIPTRPGRKVYITRSNQQLRRLVNEPDLVPVLQKFGFEILYFEGMSFTQQLTLMVETEIFISLHGSNMVNILFMQPGTRVIEMMNQDYLNDAYYLLASSLGLHYYSMPCTMDDETNSPVTKDRVALNDADVRVDVAQLAQLVGEAISNSSTIEVEGREVRN
jgi:capsular polysaccharide biosynthesis protein